MRNQLPQDYIIDDGVTISDCTDLAGFSSGSNCDFTLEDDGIKAESLTVGTTWKLDKDISIDFSNVNTIYVEFDIDDISAFNSGSPFTVYITDNNFGRYFQRDYYPSASFAIGKNTLKICKSEFTSYNNPIWNTTMNKIRFAAKGAADKKATVTFNDIVYNKKSIQKVLFTFDDGYKSVLTKAKPILDTYDYAATCFVVHTILSGTDTNYMRLEDLQTLKDNGYCIGSHSQDHVSLTSLTLAEAEAQLAFMRDWLQDNGFDYKTLAYPYGYYNADIISIVKNLGINFARTTLSGSNASPLQTLTLKQLALTNATTFGDGGSNDIKIKIDRAVTNQDIIVFMGHNIVDSGASDSTQVLTSVFQAIVNYIAQLNLSVITASELINGITNPRNQVNRV